MKGHLSRLARPFAHANYRRYFYGQSVSFVGNWMQSAAQAWLVYRLTGSAVMLGLTAFANQLPVFLLAPIGGAYADHHGRRTMLLYMQWCGLVLALLLAALTWSGHIRVAGVIALAVLTGIVSAFEIPARQALLVELVGKRDLLNAVAMNSAIVNIARVVGPALAGLVIAVAGEAWCFAANGATYFAMIAALAAMQLPAKPPRGTSNVLRQSWDGVRFALGVRPIRALLLLLGISSLFAAPYLVLMPVFAAQILGGGPRTLGLLLGAAGAGALLGALVLASRDGARGLGGWVVAACAGFGLSVIAFAQSRSLVLSLALLPLVGFFMMVQMAATNTLMQIMAPDRLRARVMAVYTMTLLGMAPIGGLIAGALAHTLGAPLTLSIGGGLCVLAALAFLRYLPTLRKEAREFILAQSAAGGEPPHSTSAPLPPPARPKAS